MKHHGGGGGGGASAGTFSQEEAAAERRFVSERRGDELGQRGEVGGAVGTGGQRVVARAPHGALVWDQLRRRGHGQGFNPTTARTSWTRTAGDSQQLSETHIGSVRPRPAEFCQSSGRFGPLKWNHGAEGNKNIKSMHVLPWIRMINVQN